VLVDRAHFSNYKRDAAFTQWGVHPITGIGRVRPGRKTICQYHELTPKNVVPGSALHDALKMVLAHELSSKNDKQCHRETEQSQGRSTIGHARKMRCDCPHQVRRSSTFLKHVQLVTGLEETTALQVFEPQCQTGRMSLPSSIYEGSEKLLSGVWSG
jgi:hypothetical protein